MKKIWKDNYDTCYNAALECSSRAEFRKRYGKAYMESLKVRENGKRWIDDYYWLATLRNHRGDDEIYQIALNYKSLRDIKEFDKNLYQCILRRGIENYPWLQKSENIFEGRKDNAYAYFFDEFKSVYIGRSIQPLVRDRQHRTNQNGTILKFSNKHNIPIPQMTILESNLTPDEGLEKEDYYVKKYKEDGWNVLNKAKTGKNSGALGTINDNKRSKNKIIESAKRFTLLKDFRENAKNDYEAALRKGILKDLCWLEKDLTFQPKPVLQLTLGGNLMSFFESASKATKFTNCKQGRIAACCRGEQQTTGGFKWMYMDDYLADWWDTQMDIAA